MGMNVSGGGSGVRSDINVTPLVDVVLVLLIIFLVTMPIMTRQITIEIPPELDTETEVFTKFSEQITVTLKADNQLNLRIGSSSEIVSIQALTAKLRPILAQRTDEKTVFVDADLAARYGTFVRVKDLILSAGATKIAWIDKQAIKTTAPQP